MGEKERTLTKEERNMALKEEFDVIHVKIMELLHSENADYGALRALIDTQIHLSNHIDRESL